MADVQPNNVQPNTARQLTGDDIISEILRNCEAGAFKIRYSTVLPCIYHVYLHPADYDAIRPVTRALTGEARSALIERLEQLSNSSRPSKLARTLGFDSDRQMEYKILDPDWTIDFHPDVEGKLERGDIEVYSELASVERPEFEGAMTRHVTRRMIVEPPTEQSRDPKRVGTSGDTAYAYIRYEDGEPRVFPITKNQVVIGRGGKSFWVDVKLNAPPDVSREHCRIRRDEITNRFFIKDVSQYGTAIDGSRIPTSVEDRNGEQLDTNVEVPLPARCRVTLADVFHFEFEVTPPR
jgi:FHA domain